MPDDATSSRFPTQAERLTAFHEAGHAVMAELAGRLLTEVEIVGDREHSGMVHSLAFPSRAADGDDPDEIECQLKIMLAGLVAEAIVTGRKDWDEGSEDLESAVRLAMRLVDDCEDVLPLLSDIRDDLERELRDQWTAVDTLAAELLIRKALTGTEVRNLLQPHLA